MSSNNNKCFLEDFREKLMAEDGVNPLAQGFADTINKWIDEKKAKGEDVMHAELAYWFGIFGAKMLENAENEGASHGFAFGYEQGFTHGKILRDQRLAQRTAN